MTRTTDGGLQLGRGRAFGASLAVHGLALALAVSLAAAPTVEPPAAPYFVELGAAPRERLDPTRPEAADAAPRELPELEPVQLELTLAERSFFPPEALPRPGPAGPAATGFALGPVHLRLPGATPRPATAPVPGPRPVVPAPPARPRTPEPSDSPRPGPKPPAPVRREPPRPRADRCPAPTYPRSSRVHNEQGLVLLRVHLDAAGEVLTATLLHSSGFERLDEAAIDAVREWQFEPARENDHTVPGVIDVPIGFRLE